MAGMTIKKWNGEKGLVEENKRPKVIDEVNDPFARQKLITWWDQDKIEDATIGVFGVGAIGNELVHNAALLGFKKMVLFDLDRIELSNLSRTLLFGKEDEGKKKAEVAAERARKLCLANDPQIDWFCGDVMYEVGSGVFRRFDIILGCLDNDATRFYIDKQCTRFGKPWINAGISELSAGLQLFNHKETGTCFHCGESYETIARIMSRKASCGKTAIADLKVGKIPTVQVASAIVAGMQAQEMVKYICGKHVDWGKNFYYQGSNNTFEVSRTRVDEYCMHNHFAVVENVLELENITQESTMREFIAEAKKRLGINGKLTVDLSDEQGREYIHSAYCAYCGANVPVKVPRYKFKDEMAVCELCKQMSENGEPSEPIVLYVYCFNEEETAPEILDTTLGELGLPPLHVVRMCDEEENDYYVEMTGDLPRIMPNIFGKKEE